jgi:hypothetical protein
VLVSSAQVNNNDALMKICFLLAVLVANACVGCAKIIRSITELQEWSKP